MVGGFDEGAIDGGGGIGAAGTSTAPFAAGRATGGPGAIEGGPLGPLSDGFDIRQFCYLAAEGKSRCDARAMPLLALMEF
jgi:hypothetical protein